MKNRGFTLIEMLVVIGIITMILAVLFPNFMGARQRARDVQRKNDLSQMQKALELYKLDQSPQAYPTDGAFPGSFCSQCWSSGADCGGNIYMRKFPCDPGSLAPTPYIYKAAVGISPLQYTISACLENFVDPDRDLTPEPTCAASATSYTIHEP
jgi:type II secretion system protein G